MLSFHSLPPSITPPMWGVLTIVLRLIPCSHPHPQQHRLLYDPVPRKAVPSIGGAWQDRWEVTQQVGWISWLKDPENHTQAVRILTSRASLPFPVCNCLLVFLGLVHFLLMLTQAFSSLTDDHESKENLGHNSRFVDVES